MFSECDVVETLVVCKCWRNNCVFLKVMEV